MPNGAMEKPKATKTGKKKTLPPALQDRLRVMKMAKAKGIKLHKENGKGFKKTEQLKKELGMK